MDVHKQTKANKKLQNCDASRWRVCYQRGTRPIYFKYKDAESDISSQLSYGTHKYTEIEKVLIYAKSNFLESCAPWDSFI